jgi:L-malate glycosyltransferase
LKKVKTRYILQPMGMHSMKYGGMEKFIVLLARELCQYNIALIVVYNSKPASVEFLDDLAKTGGKLVVADAMKPIVYFRAFVKIFFNYRPILVHAHFQYYYSVFFARVLFCRNIFTTLHPMITDNNSMVIASIKQISLSTRISRFILNKFSSRIFAVSDAVRDQYISLFPFTVRKAERFYLGSLPNDCKYQSANEKLCPSPDKVLIGTIGFNSPIKGLDILVNALVILKKRYNCNNYILYHIGIDPDDIHNRELLDDCIQKGVSDSIVWMGIRNDVPSLLPGMDIYCQPSRSEALSLSIVEAGMAGLPVVASRVGGIPEVVIEGETGLLFEVGDAEQLAMQLFTLINDRELRLKMGERSKSLMMKEFNINNQAKVMAEKYIEIIR